MKSKSWSEITRSTAAFRNTKPKVDDDVSWLFLMCAFSECKDTVAASGHSILPLFPCFPDSFSCNTRGQKEEVRHRKERRNHASGLHRACYIPSPFPPAVWASRYGWCWVARSFATFETLWFSMVLWTHQTITTSEMLFWWNTLSCIIITVVTTTERSSLYTELQLVLNYLAWYLLSHNMENTLIRVYVCRNNLFV